MGGFESSWHYLFQATSLVFLSLISFFYLYVRGGFIENKTPKGIMRSAVPLPCLFDVVKSQNVAGQRPRQGTKSCRIGRNSVHPSPLWLALRPCWLVLRLWGARHNNTMINWDLEPLFLSEKQSICKRGKVESNLGQKSNFVLKQATLNTKALKVKK